MSGPNDPKSSEMLKMMSEEEVKKMKETEDIKNELVRGIVINKSVTSEALANVWNILVPSYKTHKKVFDFLLLIAGKVHFSPQGGFSVSDIDENMEKAIKNGRTGTKAFNLQKTAKFEIQFGMLKYINEAVGKSSWSAFVQAHQEFLATAALSCFVWVSPPADLFFSELTWSALQFDDAFIIWSDRVNLCAKILLALNLPASDWFLGDTNKTQESALVLKVQTLVKKAENLSSAVPNQAQRRSTVLSSFPIASAHYVAASLLMRSVDIRRGLTSQVSALKRIMSQWDKAFGSWHRATPERMAKVGSLTMAGLRPLERTVSLVVRIVKKELKFTKTGPIKPWPTADELK